MQYKRRWSVTLGDYQPHIIDDNSVLETIYTVQHGDLATVIAQNIPPIPKGTQFKVEKIWQNFYGTWVQVIYSGRIYDIPPASLRLVKRENNTEK
jgi:hypothetical protein